MIGKRCVAAFRGAVLLASGILSASAICQTASYTGSRALIDENSVDLSTGAYTLSAASISVGGANGLTWSQGYDDFWASAIVKSVNSSTGKTELLVVAGGIRSMFVQNGTTYTPKETNGSSLSLGGTLYTFRTASGTVINLLKTDMSVFVDPKNREELPVDSTDPNGQKMAFTYRKVTISGGCDPAVDA